MLIAQSCLTLCKSLDRSPPGSSVHGIFRQEYWSGLPLPPPGDLPEPGIKLVSPVSLALQADSLPTEPWGSPMKPVKFRRKKIFPILGGHELFLANEFFFFFPNIEYKVTLIV